MSGRKGSKRTQGSTDAQQSQAGLFSELLPLTSTTEAPLPILRKPSSFGGKGSFKCCPEPCRDCGDLALKIQADVRMKKKMSAVAKKGDDDLEVDVYATGQAWKNRIEAIEDATVRECVAEFLRGTHARMKVCISRKRA